MAGEGKEKEFKALKDEIRSLHVSVHFYVIFLLMHIHYTGMQNVCDIHCTGMCKHVHVICIC